MLQTKTERLADGLLLLFVGFNPSPKSAETGWNYAGPNNRFYRILFASGLTDRRYAPSEGPELLERYHYGFTNLVTRPTPRASDVSVEEYRSGAQRLNKLLLQYKPKFTCFVGKGVYLPFARIHRLPLKIDWGFQTMPEALATTLFVGPGTSGLVRMSLDEQVRIYHNLAMAIRESDNEAHEL